MKTRYKNSFILLLTCITTGPELTLQTARIRFIQPLILKAKRINRLFYKCKSVSFGILKVNLLTPLPCDNYNIITTNEILILLIVAEKLEKSNYKIFANIL